jgi:large subunit ribosomal protein L7A
MMVGSMYSQVPKKYKVPGAKAVLKAMDKGIVAQVLVAEDAEAHVLAGVLARAKALDIEINWVSSMKQLGEYCGINVGASCCAILKPEKGG